MPFRWTVNPYRGCTHACSYCSSGETPILMADGRQRPLRDLKVGDAIYGTWFDGKYRRYTTTPVLAHWQTRKRAHRVTLADGTELIASGDHRFLAGRGWKHVTGAMSGPDRRPYLTTNDSLLGFGALPETPAGDRSSIGSGYLARDDPAATARSGTTSTERDNARRREHHTFRLALADGEALTRSRRFLSEEAISTDEFCLLGCDRDSPCGGRNSYPGA